MDEKQVIQLIEKSLEARNRSYVPYSHFSVGAALLTGDGQIIQGCNVENASYGATNCAERTAIFKAVSEGITDFRAIAISGGAQGEDPADFAYPCGICRQVMAEFCDPDFPVIIARSVEDYQIHPLRELLACSFTNKNLS